MPKPATKTNDEDFLSEAQIEVIGQLEESKNIAAKLFGLKNTEEVTPEMTFGIYDRVFDAFDLDEDESEDDED